MGSQLMITNTAVLAIDAINNATTMSMHSTEGFLIGEYVVAKAPWNSQYLTEVMQIENIFGNDFYVSRNAALDAEDLYSWFYAADGTVYGTIEDLRAGQVFSSLGITGSGFIKISADPNDSETPYIDVWERDGVE